MEQDIKNIDFSSEWEFLTSRSSGKGGQHVNKTETKVELRFNIPESKIFTEEEKQRLLKNLQTKITNQGILQITSDNERSQYLNKKDVINRFYKIMEEALKVYEERKPTTEPEYINEKRLKDKKIQSKKKKEREKYFGKQIDDYTSSGNNLS